MIATQNQRFDVTALVEEVDEPQSIKNGRLRQSIKLIDHAVDRENVVETKISFFSDDPRTTKDNATIDILRNAAHSKEPLTLFGLSGKKLGNGYSIENSKEFFVVEAIGDRAEKLEDKASELLLTPAADREIIQQGSSGWRNYKDELACNRIASF